MKKEPFEPVTIHDADVTIHANGMEITNGTLIINSDFKYQPLKK